MKRFFFLPALALVTLFSSSQASAFIDGQLLLGQRFAEFDGDGSSESITATEVTIAGHISPIPIFGFGLFFTNHTYNTSDDGDVVGYDDLAGNQLGAEVTADFPIDVFDLGIYGKAGYAFYGVYKGESSGATFTDPESGETASFDLEGTYNVSGYKLAAGLKWTPIAIVSALLELNYGAEKWELDEFKVGGSKTSVDGDVDQTFTTILVGAEVSI